MEASASCPTCKQPVQIAWNFCPNCGYTLRVKPKSISFGKQLGLYLLSFLLPPFGLGPAFGYLREKDKKAKAVGIVCIILTIVSLALVVVSFKVFMDYYSQLLNSLTNPNLR